MIVLLRHNNIFLIGPPAAGKTSIGKNLARRLDRMFFDSDQEIERTAGADLGWIVDVEGERGFQARERQAIEELSRLRGIVLATGGTAVLEEETRLILRNNGIIVYLHVGLEEQVRRTQRDKRRPLLQHSDKRLVLSEILEQREPLYRELADLTVSTDNRSVHSVVSEIVQQLEIE